MREQEREAIRFYCGIGERTWNYHPVAPGAFACISPVYGREEGKRTTNSVTVPSHHIQIIQDSGAFSDGPQSRLSPQGALQRQELHAARYEYAEQITHRASYDLLIDEKWESGIRRKARWTERAAEEAVRVTIESARFLHRHRNGYALIQSAQGVSPRQYLRCAQEILPFLEEGDLFGLGGWCVTGKFPRVMLPVFRETMHLLLPFLAQEGIRDVHLWGVIYAPALAELLWLCDQYGMRLSTDSIGPSTRPPFGRWGYAEWVNPTYQKPPVLPSCLEKAFDECDKAGRCCTGWQRHLHVEATRRWLASFRGTPHYPQGAPTYLTTPHQLSLLMGGGEGEEEERSRRSA